MKKGIVDLKTARAYRYHQWAGNPDGRAYVEGRCAQPVWETGRAQQENQCARKNGHGVDGIFCKAHVPVDKSSSKIIYRVNEWLSVEEIEIYSETEKTYQTRWGKQVKIPNKDFLNKLEAYQHVLSIQKRNLASIKSDISRTEKTLNELK